MKEISGNKKQGAYRVHFHHENSFFFSPIPNLWGKKAKKG
jgi:hypothetical protein